LAKVQELSEFRNSKISRNNGGGDDGMSDLERRVQNLEVEAQKMREQLNEIKYQNNIISLKLENVVTKSDLLQFQNTVTSSQAQSFNQLPSVSEIKLIVSEEMKKIPSSNDIKNILNDTIKDKKLMTETQVENVMMKQRNSTIKWVIGTGIAIVAAVAGVLKLFIH
jgi:hypothetical protein